MEPGLEWKDVARDKFASADVASLDGSSIVSITGRERQRRLRPRCEAGLNLSTHASPVFEPRMALRGHCLITIKLYGNPLPCFCLRPFCVHPVVIS
jgi:hypothetical protein